MHNWICTSSGWKNRGNPVDNNIALKLAKAVRERRKRLESGAKKELDQPTSFLDKSKSAFLYADRLAGEMVDGMLSILPYTQSQLHKIGVGVSDEERAAKSRGSHRERL